MEFQLVQRKLSTRTAAISSKTQDTLHKNTPARLIWSISTWISSFAKHPSSISTGETLRQVLRPPDITTFILNALVATWF
ncbi:unnamed protein product [Absidia cylindrospora]